MESYPEFSRLVGIMNILMGPDGCPWDREQTHESLIKYLREESFEVIEAVYSGDDEHLCEELGDLILQVVFHAGIAKARGSFDIRDVLNSISRKLENRHPHVFDKNHVIKSSLDEQWEEIKKDEKALKNAMEVKDCQNISSDSIDPWLAAERMQILAAKEGFDWDSAEGILKKLSEESREFKKELKTGDRKRMAEETGDMLFTMVNLCRYCNMDPLSLIKKAGKKFEKRYAKMLEIVKSDKPGLRFKKMSLKEKEKYWQKAKKA